MTSEGTIITFYSYKGGVGRTLALANIGALLSSWGYRVLCVDWDLEAPGLHLYFEQYTIQGDQPGLSELIQSFADGNKPRWQDHVSDVRFSVGRQPLQFISACKQDGTSVRRPRILNWGQLYDELDLGLYVEELRQEWKDSFDFILIDSRTGITDIGGICTIQLPDMLTLLFTTSHQSFYGCLDVAGRAEQARENLPYDRAKLLVLPVVTRLELRREYQLAQEWLETFAGQLESCLGVWKHRDVLARDLLNFLRVPHIPFWSFGERLPVIERGTKDPEDLGYALETLGAIVAQRLAYTDVLMRNRDSYVAAVRQSSGQPDQSDERERSRRREGSARVFVTYSYRDRPLFEELEKHLSLLKSQCVILDWTGSQCLEAEDQQVGVHPRLEEAQVILMLVSADYLASRYVYEAELKRALERQEAGEAIVIPVILRAVNWEGTTLGMLNAVPSGGKPVVSWGNRDEAWSEIAREVQQATRAFVASRGYRPG